MNMCSHATPLDLNDLGFFVFVFAVASTAPAYKQVQVFIFRSSNSAPAYNQDRRLLEPCVICGCMVYVSLFSLSHDLRTIGLFFKL